MTEADVRTAPAPEPQSLDAGTSYIVLAKMKDSLTVPQSWEKVARVNARSPEAAARQHAEATGTDGMFVVIPQRNWNEVTLKKNTVTTFEVS